MSRHSTYARFGGRNVIVVAGYDRPMDELFLQVYGMLDDDDLAELDTPVYCSIQEPRRDWSTIDTVGDKLRELGIDVPDTLLEAVALDQAVRAGNRIVWHPWRGVPSEIGAMQD